MPVLSLSCSIILLRFREAWGGWLFIAVRDTPLAEVIRRKFDGDPIPLQDLDIVHPHLSGNMGEDFVAVFEFHAKRCIRQRLFDHAIDFNRPLFGHLLRIIPHCATRNDGTPLKID